MKLKLFNEDLWRDALKQVVATQQVIESEFRVGKLRESVGIKNESDTVTTPETKNETR